MSFKFGAAEQKVELYLGGEKCSELAGGSYQIIIITRIIYFRNNDCNGQYHTC